MNEEIDIIELLKRVKEGKAPKEIAINNAKFKFIEEYLDINSMYECIINGNRWINEDYINFDTKIKILDKPIIEELPTTEIVHRFEDNSIYERKKVYSTDELADKINEIIKFLNNKE